MFFTPRTLSSQRLTMLSAGQQQCLIRHVCLLQVFFIFAVVTNLLVSTSMLQGCVAVVNALTGVNIYGEHRSLCPSVDGHGPASPL